MATVSSFARPSGDNTRLNALAEKTTAAASRITSLALAANCVLTRSSLADAGDRETVALDLIETIKTLAGDAESAAEKALEPQP
jgi:hypothetical protein